MDLVDSMTCLSSHDLCCSKVPTRHVNFVLMSGLICSCPVQSLAEKYLGTSSDDLGLISTLFIGKECTAMDLLVPVAKSSFRGSA